MGFCHVIHTVTCPHTNLNNCSFHSVYRKSVEMFSSAEFCDFYQYFITQSKIPPSYLDTRKKIYVLQLSGYQDKNSAFLLWCLDRNSAQLSGCRDKKLHPAIGMPGHKITPSYRDAGIKNYTQLSGCRDKKFCQLSGSQDENSAKISGWQDKKNYTHTVLSFLTLFGHMALWASS